MSQPLSIIDIITVIALGIGFLIYIRKFPIFRVLLGMVFLVFCALVFYLGRLYITASIFGLGSLFVFISLPLIFAPEIRHYLEKLGRFPFLHVPKVTTKQKRAEFIRSLVDAIFELTERRIGATIVLERKTGLGETIETGVIIDAKFGAKLLHSIFYPKNPLHDGAVIIKDDRIIAAGCLLPISSEVKLPTLGTRHKSAVAITQDTDAVVLIISEERGEVSLAENGKLELNVDRMELTQKLQQLF